MLRISAVVLVVLMVGAAAIYHWFTNEYTRCFAEFSSPEAAERAASDVRAAGSDADVESPGEEASARRVRGGRHISVEFSDGETGEDAAVFRQTVQLVVDREGGDNVSYRNRCMEESRWERFGR